GRVIEQDLALNPAEDWAAGPGYPGLSQIDLESVLLHELGHMAGNKRHRAVCANSPMIAALGAGEWWRGARDHWFDQCSGVVVAAVFVSRRAASASRTAASASRTAASASRTAASASRTAASASRTPASVSGLLAHRVVPVD